MKRYSKYKDSGVEWLGEIPDGWQVSRLSYITNGIGDGLHATPEYTESSNYYFVNGNNLRNGKIDLSTTAKFVKEEEYLKHKVSINENTILLSINGTIGNIAKYNNEKVVLGKSAAYINCQDSTFRDFFYYFCLSEIFKRYYSLELTGTTISNLSLNSIRKMPVLLPSNAEQKVIAYYLDKKNSQIDVLIKKKMKMIELLKEERAAIINHAVTKGIDSDAKMKDSGIELLGEVPKGWHKGKLKHVCSIIKDGTHLPPKRVIEGVPILSIRNIVNGKFVLLPDDSKISQSDFELLEKSYQVKKDDVLLAIVGATIGKTAIVDNMPPFTIQRSVAYFRTIAEKLINTFLHVYFQSDLFQRMIWLDISYSAQPGIYLNTLEELFIYIPSLKEQVEIVKYINDKTGLIDSAIEKAEKEIQLVEEYRTALINEAVTGKIKV
jgi:type I restriction enzyme S subunit